ncbi:MAG: hypothetical protein OXG95_11125 [Chloroflexi bacterium]|nr:hypothetical protein [Chloroflexota bacterium]
MADTYDRRRPFRESGYSAYLDDEWTDRDTGEVQGVGQDSLQREVQALAMVLCGEGPANAATAKDNLNAEPEERIGPQATALLRNAPSGNISPFRGSAQDAMPKRLVAAGQGIGWELLCSAKPRLRAIVTLANSVQDVPWRTILLNSNQRLKADYEQPLSRGRTYREVTLVKGPLKDTLIIGLPAVVRHRGTSKKLSQAIFRELATRVDYHGLAVS